MQATLTQEGQRPIPTQPPNLPHLVPRHWAVPFYRSKFTEWLAGAVPDSYPNVDLL
jgi:hypothetical protein